MFLSSVCLSVAFIDNTVRQRLHVVDTDRPTAEGENREKYLLQSGGNTTPTEVSISLDKEGECEGTKGAEEVIKQRKARHIQSSTDQKKAPGTHTTQPSRKEEETRYGRERLAGRTFSSSAISPPSPFFSFVFLSCVVQSVHTQTHLVFPPQSILERRYSPLSFSLRVAAIFVFACPPLWLCFLFWLVPLKPAFHKECDSRTPFLPFFLCIFFSPYRGLGTEAAAQTARPLFQRMSCAIPLRLCLTVKCPPLSLSLAPSCCFDGSSSCSSGSLSSRKRRNEASFAFNLSCLYFHHQTAFTLFLSLFPS